MAAERESLSLRIFLLSLSVWQLRNLHLKGLVHTIFSPSELSQPSGRVALVSQCLLSCADRRDEDDLGPALFVIHHMDKAAHSIIPALGGGRSSMRIRNPRSSLVTE